MTASRDTRETRIAERCVEWRRTVTVASVTALRQIKPTPLQRILVAYTVNQLGWWFALVALSLSVYSQTKSSLAVAAVLAVPFIPALLAPAVVARVEASPRRGGLTVLYAIEAVCAVGLAAAVWQFSLPAILVLVALDGSVAYAARALLRSEAARAGEEAAEGPSLPEHARSEKAHSVHRANASINVSLALTGVAGPALGSLAVHGIGGSVALLIDAGFFVVSGSLLLDLRPHIEELSSSVRARLAAARDFLRTARRLRLLIVTQALAMVFFYCAIPAEVGYATATLHAGALGYGALLGTWGVGQVAGSLLFARAERWLWGMLSVGTLAVGVAYLGYAAAPSLRVACLAALPGGLGNGVQWAAFLGIVQGHTPERLLGRMMGVVESASATAPVLGYALGGALALSSPRVAFLTAGLASCVAMLMFMRIRGLRRGSGEAVATDLDRPEEAPLVDPGVPNVAP